ncbi:MAG: NAD(P)-dependent oxidoreductase [Anaerolineae bacterium]|nr:NAD(P)-dependent oxidoreductase [Anaerolineae bacterium]
MKVLVTGSSGRLGPYVVSELEQAGHEVALFTRRKPAPALQHLQWIEGDIRSFDDCTRAMAEGYDAVQHLAAQAWPTDHPEQRAMADERGIPFDTTMRSNIMGLYYLLQAAIRAGVGVFVMTGSNCALGHGYRISDHPFPFRYLPVDEAHPSAVEDAYSYSKLAGEMLLASYTSAYGIRTYAVRAAGICNEERRRAIAARAAPITAWSDWLWAWVGSEDVASAHRLLMEQAHQIEPHGVYFCNADDTTALEPSVQLIETFRPDLLPLVRDLDGHASLLSNRRLRESVGWTHRTSWRQYLAERKG